VANPFFPGVLLPGLTFIGLYLWPVIERRLSRDRDAHNLLDRPRDRPRRTALGVAVFTFYAVLFVAGANDVLAARAGTSVNAMTEVLRVLLFVVPSLVALLTWKVCRDLGAGDPPDVEASPVTAPAPTVDDRSAPEPAAVAGAVGAAAGRGPGSGHSDRHVRGLVVEGGALAVLGALAYVTGRVLGRNHPGGPG
jgi:ubiquinol-cytochrome c reductase cytochrome b subunit